VYAADPLLCQWCGGTMRIIAFIDQPDAIEKILTHLGLWPYASHGKELIKDPSWAFLRTLGPPTPKVKCYHRLPVRDPYPLSNERSDLHETAPPRPFYYN